MDTAAHDGPSAITQSVWWVGRSTWGEHPMLTHPTDCNIFLFKGETFDVLIDSGGNASVQKLERNIRRAGSDPDRVGEIWCTHSHLDHFVGAGHWIARHPRTRCRISHLAAKFLRSGDERLIAHRFAPRWNAEVRIPRRLAILREGDVVECPPFKLRVMELPGHAPDSLSFRGQVDGMDVMFGGDVVIGDQNGRRGLLGWLDGYWLSNVRAYEKSLRRLALRPPQLLLPGHGLPLAHEAVRRSVRNCLRRIRRFAEFADMCPLAMET